MSASALDQEMSQREVMLPGQSPQEVSYHDRYFMDWKRAHLSNTWLDLGRAESHARVRVCYDYALWINAALAAQGAGVWVLLPDDIQP